MGSKIGPKSALAPKGRPRPGRRPPGGLLVAIWGKIRAPGGIIFEPPGFNCSAPRGSNCDAVLGYSSVVLSFSSAMLRYSSVLSLSSAVLDFSSAA